MKPSTKILAIVALVFFLTLPSFTLAAESAAPQEKKAASPIQIEADHMVSNQKENSVFFSGKVEAEQGDVIIHADEMTVYYKSASTLSNDTSKNTADNSRNIQRLWAVGHVEITKEEWVATGDTAEYFEDERKVVLVGNTKVWQDNNLVTGDKFIMYLDEGKSIVERSSKKDERVKAFFYPQADQEE